MSYGVGLLEFSIDWPFFIQKYLFEKLLMTHNIKELTCFN